MVSITYGVHWLCLFNLPFVFVDEQTSQKCNSGVERHKGRVRDQLEETTPALLLSCLQPLLLSSTKLIRSVPISDLCRWVCSLRTRCIVLSI